MNNNDHKFINYYNIKVLNSTIQVYYVYLLYEYTYIQCSTYSVVKS